MDLVAAASRQVELRRLALAKFPAAERMWFTREGLEQASSAAAATHRADRLPGPVVDLCCGIGGDLVALAGSGPAVAVDRDPVHLRMSALNVAALNAGVPVTAICADVRDAVGGGVLDGAGAVFVDPARRAGGRRLRTGVGEPPLEWCAGLADRVPAVAVKAAPGLDVAAVPPGWEVEFVASGRDLKEAVLWSPALAGPRTRATVLGVGSYPAGSAAPGPVAAPGRWLLDPNPALTRAGLVTSLGRDLGAWQIDEHIAFLSCDDRPVTPWARVLRVERSLPWHLRELATVLGAAGVGPLDVRRRGLAGDVDGLARRLKLTGDRRVTLAMTRVAGRPWAIVCVDPDDPPL